VVPSALTETIRHFEAEAGASLFDRSQRPPVPTPLALAFLQETAPLLEGLDLALDRLRARRDQTAGRLSIGCTPSARFMTTSPNGWRRAWSRGRWILPSRAAPCIRMT